MIYQHNLDAKGRLFIPARMKEDMGSTFYVTLSVDKCLSVYGVGEWEKVTERIYALSYGEQRKMRPLLAYSAKCELDSQGRILIPQNLREYAGLVKTVSVVDCGNHAELWDSHTWEEENPMDAVPMRIADAFREVGF